MASLTSSINFGGSTSSLFKSATTIKSQIATQQDEIARLTYEDSAHTDADFAAYKAYLQGRIGSLQSTGSVVDATKALTMQQDVISAQARNTSANIQRENIAIMAGSATPMDKYNLIANEYTQAVNAGDMSLAQTLESQAYSLSQSIQDQAAKATAAGQAISASRTSAGTSALSEAQKMLEQGFKNNGEKGMEAVVKGVVNTYRTQLAANGVILPKDAQPNAFDLMQGIAQAQITDAANRYAAYALTDPAKAQTALNQGANIMNGYTKFNVGGKNLSFQELQIAASNPDAMTPVQSADGSWSYQWNKVAGQTYQTFTDGNGHTYTALAPDYGGQDRGYNNRSTYINPAQVQMLYQAGFDVSKMTKTVTTTPATYNKVTGQEQTKATTTKELGGTSGMSVQLTDNAPQWLKDIAGNGSKLAVYSDNAGNTYFGVNAGTDQNGNPVDYKLQLQSVGGKLGAFWQLPDGQFQRANSDYGFNWGAAELLVNMGSQIQRSMQDKVSVANLPPTLPAITIPKVNTPNPVSQATITQSQARNQLQQTASVQRIQNAAPVQQAPASSTRTLQNAAGNIQSGGQGIAIKGTVNGNPGAIKL